MHSRAQVFLTLLLSAITIASFVAPMSLSAQGSDPTLEGIYQAFEDVGAPPFEACATDAYLCPNGTYVRRSRPSCEFVCPATPSASFSGRCTESSFLRTCTDVYGAMPYNCKIWSGCPTSCARERPDGPATCVTTLFGGCVSTGGSCVSYFDTSVPGSNTTTNTNAGVLSLPQSAVSCVAPNGTLVSSGHTFTGFCPDSGAGAVCNLTKRCDNGRWAETAAVGLTCEASGVTYQEGAVIAACIVVNVYTCRDSSGPQGMMRCTGGQWVSTVAVTNTDTTSPPAAFVVGDRVRAIDDVRVRSGTSLSESILAVQNSGTLGTIIGGPTNADGYVWWNVDWDVGPNGWSVQNFLEKVQETVATTASCTFNNQIILHGQATTTYQAATVPLGQQCLSQQRVCANGVLSGSYTHASCTAAQSTNAFPSSNLNLGVIPLRVIVVNIPEVSATGGSAGMIFTAAKRDEASQATQRLDSFVRTSSYGRASVQPSVSGVYQLAGGVCDHPTYTEKVNDLVQRSLQVADAESPLPNYSSYLIYHPSPSCPDGIAWSYEGVPFKEYQLNGRLVHLRGIHISDLWDYYLFHEFGHMLGYQTGGEVGHPAYMQCALSTGASGETVIPISSVCTSVYDWAAGIVPTFTIMSAKTGILSDYSVTTKEKIGWLNSSDIQTASTGRYTLTAVEILGGTKALKVSISGTDYTAYISFRQPVGYVYPAAPSNKPNGVIIDIRNAGGTESFLVTDSTNRDAPLTIGRDYRLGTNGLYVRVEAISGTTATVVVGNSVQLPVSQTSCTFNNQIVLHGQATTTYQTATVAAGQQCVSEQRTCNNGVLSGTFTAPACAPQAATCTPLTAETQTLLCPTGQVGTVVQTRASTCPLGATSPVWGSWATTTDTCATPLFSNGDRVRATDNVRVRSSASINASILATQNSGSLGAIVGGPTFAGGYTWWNVNWDTGADGWSVQNFLEKAQETTNTACTFNGQTLPHGAATTTYATATVPAGQQCVSEQRTCTNGVLSGTYTFAACSPQSAPVVAQPYPNFKVAMQSHTPWRVNIQGFQYPSEITPIFLPNPKSSNANGTEKIVILPGSSSRICLTSASVLNASVLIPQSSCFINAATGDLFKEDATGNNIWTDPSLLQSKPWTYSYDGIFTAAINPARKEIFFGRVFENQSYVNRYVTGVRDCTDPAKSWKYPSTILSTTKSYCTCAEQEYQCVANEQSALCVNGNNICPADLSDVKGNIHSWPTYTAGLTMGASSYSDGSGYAPQKITDYGPIGWPQQGGYSQAGVNIGWPGAIVKDDYLYLYYMMSPAPAGQNGGAYCYGLMRSPLSSGGRPGSWQNYANGSFSTDPLPPGFSLSNITNFYTRSGGAADCVLPPSNEGGEKQVTNWFHVARVKDTPFYIAIEESALNWGTYQQVIRFSTDLIHWSPKQVVDSAQSWGKGKYTYGRLLNAAGNDSTVIDADGFYLYGKDIQAGYSINSAKLSIIPRPPTSQYQAVINHYYAQLLNRTPTAGELSAQTTRMDTNGCPAVVQNITQTSEFTSRAASFSNSDYIKLLAKAVVARALADNDEGLQWYLANLNAGNFTRTSMLTQMAMIPEAVSACGLGKTLEDSTSTTTTPPTFAVGDRVRATASPSLNVRSTPNGSVLGTQPFGALGSVLAGPTNADGYTWWNVNWDTGADGWSVDDFLEKVDATTMQGERVLSSQAALKTFLMLGIQPNWATLPDWYSGFINWGYGANPDVSDKPQQIKGEYVSVGSVPKYPYPNYPIPFSSLDAAEENTFLHATDPAMLQLWKRGTASFELSWKADARANVSQYKVYKVWFPNDFVMPLPWTEWWKQHAWGTVTTVPASSAPAYSYSDPTSDADKQGWTVMCYMVKSVAGGVERIYSFPVCSKLADLSESPAVYVASVTPRKLWENKIDSNYANVGYNFGVAISGQSASAQGYDAKLIIYKQAGFASTANQNSGTLQEDERVPLFFDTGGVSTNLTRQRPYLLNVSGNLAVTEDPVFRVAITQSGVETVYPRDGGYYTFSANNRVQDRLWYGALVNPASSGWKSLLSSRANTLIAKGYNTFFFDTWWPDYPYRFYSEAPSVEYNPGGAMQGEYVKALENLADYLHGAFPTMTLLGNTIGQINDFAREFASISKLDGAMLETCFLTDGAKRTGATLVADIQKIDQVLAAGKMVLCWPKFQQIRWGRQIDISPFDSSTRLYALGLGLIMTQGPGGTFFYGPEELPGDWSSSLGQGINYFPEYRIDIGVPAGARQSLGTYVWQRPFTKGVVVVNADPTAPHSYTPTVKMWRVKIVGEALQLDAANQRVVNASYGTVGYDEAPANSAISIPPASALILVSDSVLTTTASCAWAGGSVPHGQSIPAFKSATVPAGQTCQSQQRTCTNGVLSGTYSYTSCAPATVATQSCVWGGGTIPHGQSVPAFQSATVPAGQQCVSEQRTCTNGVLSGTYTNPACSVQTPAGTTSMTRYPNFTNLCYAFVTGFANGQNVLGNFANTCTADARSSPLLFSVTQEVNGGHVGAANNSPGRTLYMNDYNYDTDYGEWLRANFTPTAEGTVFGMALDTANYQKTNVTGWPLQSGNLFFGMNDISAAHANVTMDKSIVVEFDIRLRGDDINTTMNPGTYSGHRIMVGTLLDWQEQSRANRAHYFEVNLKQTPSYAQIYSDPDLPLCHDTTYDRCAYDPGGQWAENRYVSYEKVSGSSLNLVTDQWVHVRIPIDYAKQLQWVSRPASWANAKFDGLYIGLESTGATRYWIEVKNYQVYYTQSQNQSCTWNGQAIPHGTATTTYQMATVSAGQTCQSEQRTCTNGVLSGTFTNPACSVETTPTASLATGDRVRATANLNVRSTPNGSILAVQNSNALGSIVGGPTTAGGFTWWNVNWDTGADGWSAQDYLERVQNTTTSTNLNWSYRPAQIAPASVSSLTMDQFTAILEEKGPNTPYFTRSGLTIGGVSADVLKIIQTNDSAHPYIGLYHSYIGGDLFETRLAYSVDLATWTPLGRIETAAGMPDAVILPDNSVLYAQERNPSVVRPYIEIRYYQTLAGFISNPAAPTKTFNLPQTANASADGTPQFGRITYNGDINNSQIEISYHYFEGTVRDRQAIGTLTNFSSWSTSPDIVVNDALTARGYPDIGDREWFKIGSTVYELIEANTVTPSATAGWDSWRVFLINKNTGEVRQLAPAIPGGATSIGNPSGAFITLPDGRPALVFGYFVFSQGSGSTPAGQHVYVYPLSGSSSSDTPAAHDFRTFTSPAYAGALKLIQPAHYSFGSAVDGAGNVYFNEYNHTRLMKYSPADGAVTPLIQNTGGMYGLAAATDGTLYIGIDSETFDGKVLRRLTNGTVQTIVTGLRRPRQLSMGSDGKLYIVLEADNKIIRWNPTTQATETVVENLQTPQGAVERSGIVYWIEYGSFGPQGQALSPGRLRMRAADGTITTLIDGIWRGRGLAIMTDGTLIGASEANELDQGNSGYLFSYKPGETPVILAAGIDYPQFPSVAAGGTIYTTLARDNWLASYTSTPQAVSLANGISARLFEGSFTTGSGDVLSLSIGNVVVPATLSGNSSAALKGWIRVPGEQVPTSKTEVAYGTNEIPTPGVFQLPAVSCTRASGAACTAKVIVERAHTGSRWPMDYSTGKELPAAGFAETPVAYWVYLLSDAVSSGGALSFAVGSRIKAIENVNVRSTPNGSILAVQNSGSLGSIIGGPTNADNFTWWNVNWDTGADGWSVQNYFEKVAEAATPSATPTQTSVALSGLFDLYSPSVYTFNGVKRMITGGWLTAADRDNYLNAINGGQNPDSIYGPDKIFYSEWNGVSWTSPILAFRKLGAHINDGSVVNPPSDVLNNRSQWLYMYYTELRNSIAVGPVAQWFPNHHIGLATSIDGGRTWTDNGIVIRNTESGDGQGAWSPGAIVVGNEIWVYYHTGTSDFSQPIMFRQKMNANGWQKIGAPERLQFSGVSKVVNLSNVDVSKQGNQYVLLGNTLDLKSIERYISTDGINWRQDSRYSNPLVSSTNMMPTPHAEIIDAETMDLYFGWNTGSGSQSVHQWRFNLENTQDTANASCPWGGGSVPHGQSVPAFQSATVPAGQQCVSEQRTCTNGVLSGTYTNAQCTVQALINRTLTYSASPPDLGVDRSDLMWEDAATQTKVMQALSQIPATWYRDNFRTASYATIAASLAKQVQNQGKHILVTILMEPTDLASESDMAYANSTEFQQKCGWYGGIPKLSKVDLSLFEQRLRANLQAYKNAGVIIDAFEIGNELDQACFNGDLPLDRPIMDNELPPVAQAYARFLEKAVSVVHEPGYYPNAAIVSFGITNSPEATSNGVMQRPAALLALLTNLNGRNYLELVDAIGLHIYPLPDDLTPVTQSLALTAQRLGANLKPIWFTEFGFRTDHLPSPSGKSLYQAYQDFYTLIKNSSVEVSAASVWELDGFTAKLALVDSSYNLLPGVQEFFAKTPYGPATSLAVGARVKATASPNLNVRATPNGSVLGTQPFGALGSVLGGPTTAGGYTWWNVNWDTGADGWSVQDYLEVQASGNSGSGATQPTNTPVTRLWLHHEWRNQTDTVDPTKQPQTPVYSALMRADWSPVYNVASMPQALKSQYVVTSVSYGNEFDSTYPSVLKYDTAGFDSDEYMFQHASDPANLNITSGNERVVLLWRPDRRSGANAATQYAVYRYIAPGTINTATLNWWDGVQWTKLATVSALTHHDTDVSCLPGKLCTPLGTTICYRIKAVTASGAETNYSIPQCHTYRGSQNRETLWWSGANVIRTSSTLRGDTYANNIYRLDVAFNQATANSVQKIDAFAYRFPTAREGCDANGVTQGNQCVTGFRQFETATRDGSLIQASAPGDFTTSLTISSVQPIIQVEGNLSGANMTADLVFRLRMTDTRGIEYWYPSDGGYITTRTNNRILDRFWTGYNMNPANAWWQQLLASYQTTMKNLGYNAMYLDEWRPLKSIEWEGLQNEAPAIEYPYPTGAALTSYLQNASPVDKWVQALEQLANRLRANQPSMELIGNTIKRWVGEAPGYTGLIRQATSLLDGAVQEECIAGVSGIHTGAQWLADLSVMEEYAQAGKTVVCLARSNALRSTFSGYVDDGIVPERRMYVLASWLLIDDLTKQMYLAPTEINTDWINYSPTYQYPQINIFPEYFVALGTPAGTRTQVGSLWKRDFTNGVVYVNPGTASASYSLPTSMQKVTIVGVVNQPYVNASTCASYPNGKCEENPGRVELVTTSAGTYSLAPGQAEIFLK